MTTSVCSAIVLHVPNVWQTCEWYRQVFSWHSILCVDGTIALLQAPGHRLLFVAHEAQAAEFGFRRLNSFLIDPPALHLDVATDNVQAIFDQAMIHGAITVAAPGPDDTGRLVATLRDLNGILIRLTPRYLSKLVEAA